MKNRWHRLSWHRHHGVARRHRATLEPGLDARVRGELAIIADRRSSTE